jgi:hypothetical protein
LGLGLFRGFVSIQITQPGGTPYKINPSHYNHRN